MGISVKNIRKSFGSFTALDDVSLEIKTGELVALLGPSGSGKTTLLRIIAGLELAEGGSIVLEGEETTDKSVRERNVGFMFQHYALFKHMTVFENVAYGLRVRKRRQRPSKDAVREKVLDLLRLVHLEGLHDRYPSQLSGGQRQRVALARALAVEPRVLLLDEPFGALDAKVRKELRRFMRRLHEDIHVTTVFVTHDQEEAMEVADRVVVMSNGKIEQVGTPAEVWNKPVNGFVYDFLGNYNEFEGWKEADGTVHLTEYDVVEATPEPSAPADQPGMLRRYPGATRFLRFLTPIARPQEKPRSHGKRFNAKIGAGNPVKLYARPHEMYVTREPDGKEEYIAATIIHINPAGPLVKLELERRNGNLLQAEIPVSVLEAQKLAKGQEVLVRPKQTRIFE
jgi:sulfate transport system ATP-binding protein